MNNLKEVVKFIQDTYSDSDGKYKPSMALIQHTLKKLDKPFSIAKYVESPHLLDLDIEVDMLNEETKGRLADGEDVIEKHTCILIKLILTRLEEKLRNEIM